MPLPEKALISQIRRTVSRSTSGRSSRRAITIGIGDDSAVLRVRAGCDTLITTDLTLEGVHFRRDWHPADSVGHRCVARGLSDIAAMGGEPVAVFLSLALPREVPQSWVERFARSLIRVAQEYGATLAGGDIAESLAGIVADIVVIGTVPAGKAILRSGARPGDRIFISGQLGGSTAAVLKMSAGGRLNPLDYRRHFYPDPRIELGRILRDKGLATAMIDTSDGLSTDLAHICEESGVGAQLDASLIPRARAGRPAREVDLALALHGGEDYELLFTAPPAKRVPRQIRGVTLTQIGEIIRGRRVSLRNSEGSAHKLEPRGWEHFRG